MSTKRTETLQKEIDAERATIRTDEYPISIGELANMYRDGELNIHPEFQRYFRWDEDRKSRFIESILLGIPIPSIFVAQQPDGVWDVVDGLQRLATIFQLMGILKDEEENVLPPLKLTKTKYLPSLENMQWDDGAKGYNLTPAQKLFIKRSKLDVKIILRESSEKTKFELFQRLNTGGAELSEQEIRNAMLVAANKPFYDWLKKLAGFESFVNCTQLSDRPLEEQFDLELVLRFIVFRTLDEAGLRSVGDLGDFLTDRMMELSGRFSGIQEQEERAFEKTFAALDEKIGSDAFRKYDVAKSKFMGGFSISAYEIVGFGLGYNVDDIDNLSPEALREKIKALWKNPEFVSSSGSGIRASSRIPKTVPLGRKLLRP
jgi:hypothetical protein